jgi:isopenicillin N synthase-like dioxygenase
MCPLTSTTSNMSPPNGSFTSIPILDFSLTKSPKTRNAFLSQLRQSLINVGFLYLSNHTVSSAVIDSLIEYIPKLFALSQEAKDDISMANSEHFLGYSRLGKELTKGKVDRREQFDFATPHVSRWKEGDPDHYRLWGPSQVSYCHKTHSNTS